jgi:hypothetical protein
MDPITAISGTVIFLFAGLPPQPIGTAFLVAYSHPSVPGTSIPLVVTAKHVLGDFPVVTARFSPTPGKPAPALVYDIAALKANGDYWEHPDPGVDLAVFRTLHPQDADYTPIDMSLIASKETFTNEQIRASDRILFPSLLVNFMGSSRNYPTLRDGSIALMPEEDVPMRYKVGTREVITAQPLLLLNAVSIPGASGAPVFLSPGPRSKNNSFVLGQTPYLLGIMHGFYPAIPRDLVEVNVTRTQSMFQENSGIAIVFPAWRLHEVLTLPAIKVRLTALFQQAGPSQ